MNFSTYRFTLDLHKHQSQTSVAVFQFDTAIELSIGITDGGLPYYFADGCKAVLYGKKPSGAPIVHDCKIVDNRIIYTFKKTTADEIGVTSCQILIYNANEQTVSVPTFILAVGERILNDDEVLDGEDTEGQYSALDALFTSEVERVTAEEGRVEAESARVTAEKERSAAETERREAEEARKEGYSQIDAKIEGKLDKTDEAYKIYGTDHNSQKVFDWSYEANANTIPRRLLNGNLVVPLKPTEAKHAAPKGYVDGLVNPLEKRVTNLESLTLDYPEITSTDYEKIVPANVGTPAFIDMVGGATKKITGKNMINPQSIRVQAFGGGGASPTVTVNNDGTFNFTLNYQQNGFAGEIYINWEDGEVDDGVYRYFVECEYPPTCAGSPQDGILAVSFELPYIGEDENDGYLGERTFENIKFMIYRDGDSDAVTFVEAPAGTVFEPYREEIVNADVERVESIGANLFDGSLINCKTEAGITVQYDSETQIFTLNGVSTKSHDFSRTYINLKGEKGKKYVLKVEIVGGTIDSPRGNSVVYFGSSDTPNRHANWYASSLLTGTSWGSVLPHEYITAFWFYIYEGSTLNNLQVKVMLARSDSDVPYKPYKSEPIDTIVIPESVKLKGINGTYYDYIEHKDGKWLQHKNVGEVDLGSLTWTVGYTSKGYVRFIADFSQVKAPASDETIANILCDKYTSKSSTDVYLANDGIAISASGKVCIYDSSLSTDTLSNFTSAIQGVKMYYELATPEVTDVTADFIAANPDFATKGNAIEIQQGGVLRLVNERKMAVPNTVGYVTRKE